MEAQPIEVANILITVAGFILMLLLSIIGFYLKKLVVTVDKLSLTVTRDNEKSKGITKQVEQNRTAIIELENKQSRHDTCENFKPKF